MIFRPQIRPSGCILIVWITIAISPEEWIDNVNDQDKDNVSCRQILKKLAEYIH